MRRFGLNGRYKNPASHDGATAIRKKSERIFMSYCDEFQYFATDTFAEILSEARKYHLNLTMAHQYMGSVNAFNTHNGVRQRRQNH